MDDGDLHVGIIPFFFQYEKFETYIINFLHSPRTTARPLLFE